jgi:hypothetical protein
MSDDGKNEVWSAEDVGIPSAAKGVEKKTVSPEDQNWTDEQVTGQDRPRGILSNPLPKDDSYLSEAGPYIGTGLVKALSHVPTMVGDTFELGNTLISGGKKVLRDWGVTNQSNADIEKQQKGAEQLRALESAKLMKFSPELGALLSPGMLTGEQVQQLVFNKTGQYVPASPAGKLGMATMEAMTPGPGGKGKKVEEAVGILPRVASGIKDYAVREGIPQAVAGASGYLAGEITGNPIVAFLAALAGGKAGSMGARAGEAHLSPDRMSELLAGQVLRESALDHTSARSGLENPPSNLFPGITPTTSQAARDPGLQVLEEGLAGHQRGVETTSPSFRLGNKAINTKVTNEEAYARGATNVADTINPSIKSAKENFTNSAAQLADDLHPDVSGDPSIYNLPEPHGQSSKDSASRSARDIFSEREQAAKEDVNKKFESIGNVNVFSKRALMPLMEAINKLPPILRKRIDPQVLSVLNEYLSEGAAPQIPLADVQAMRSDLLEHARNAASEGKGNTQRINNDLAKVILDTLSDDKTIVFRDTTGSQRKAWKDAIAAAANYHNTYTSGALERLTLRPNGVPEVGHGATLDEILSGSNRSQDVQQFRNATGFSTDPHISDYLVAKLTNNGQKTVTPSQVSNFIGANADVLQHLPGARQRLEDIASMAERQALAEKLQKTSGKPENVLKALDDHRNTINNIGDPNHVLYDSGLYNRLNGVESEAQRIGSIIPLQELSDDIKNAKSPVEMANVLTKHKDTINNIKDTSHPLHDPTHASAIDTLSSSTDYMHPIDMSRSDMANDAMFRDVTSNKIAKKLHGNFSGSIGSVGSILGLLEGMRHGLGLQELKSGLQLAGAALGTGLGTGATAARLGLPHQITQSILTGKVPAKTLETLHAARTDPAYAAKLMQAPELEKLPPLSLSGLRGGIAGQQGTEEAGNYATGGRIARASGGKVDDRKLEALVQRLMNLAKQAKKATDKTTEPLLNAPDEAIVKALGVAQEAI